MKRLYLNNNHKQQNLEINNSYYNKIFYYINNLHVN